MHLAFGTLGEAQALTIKLIDPSAGNVISRTTWQATGSNPSVFVARVPEIVRSALDPLEGAKAP